ncbi:MAG: amino acid racemase [bacterium]|nr:amino acid racemase [bacterium]
MRTIGILGGMGPQATIDLYQKILNNTPAQRDAEHLKTLIWSDPTIPDRTDAILRGIGNPLAALISGAKLLECGGAECIVMPCNTAHYYIDDISRMVSIPILNMITIAVNKVGKVASVNDKVGILATDATLQTKLYHRVISKFGFMPVQPNDDLQRVVMNIIFGEFGVKAGYINEENSTRICEVINHLVAEGVRTIIAGCTEIPLVVPPYFPGCHIIDPTNELALAAIQFAYS